MKKLLSIPVAVILLSLSSLPILSQEYEHEVLEEIRKKAIETHSDAVIIKKGETVIYNDSFGNEDSPIYIASAGKSLASLAIGKLLDKGLLDSLDQPIHTFYPQWRQGKKKDITVRMILNHTSGLQNHPNASIELEPHPDYKVDNVIELALAAELSDSPGERVNYNNKAVALIGGIVQQLSGKRFDQFFEEEFFAPMDISEYDWIRDRSGNPTVHGAFVIKPSDFLKFGELILDKGVYNGQRLISEEWVSQSFEKSQQFTPIWGLLWWRLPAFERRIIDDEIWSSWVEANVDLTFLNKIKPLKNVTYASKWEFFEALNNQLGDDWLNQLNKYIPPPLQSSKRIYSDEITAYYADGFRGNYQRLRRCGRSGCFVIIAFFSR